MKKQLLKETEIRKMMKFANIGPLTDSFVERLNETALMEQEPEEEEAGAAVPMGEPGAEEPMDDAPMGEPEAEEPMDAAPMDDLGGEGGEEKPLDTKIENLMDAVKAFLSPEDAEKIQVQSEPDVEAGAPEGDMDMDAPEGDMDMGAPEGDEDMGELEDDEAPEEPMEEELVNEVARRVAKRLRALR